MPRAGHTSTRMRLARTATLASVALVSTGCHDWEIFSSDYPPHQTASSSSSSSVTSSGAGGGDGDAGKHDPACMVCSAQPCAPTQLALAAVPLVLTIDETAVYWVSYFGPVGKIGIDGRDVQMLSDRNGQGSGVAVRGDDVYFTLLGDVGGTNGELWRVPKTGGAATPLAQNLTEPAGIRSYTDALYLALAGTVAKLKPGGSFVDLATDQQAPITITRNNDYVFWAQLWGDVLGWMSAGGGPVTTFPSQSPGPAGVAIDLTYLYWATRGPPAGDPPTWPQGTLWRMRLDAIAKGAQPSDVEMLVTDQRSVSSLALDDENVYFTTEGGVSRVPKAGGAALQIAGDQIKPQSIAVDANCVYWVNNVFDGAVMTLPKAP